jgi:hypothetical protein
MRIEQLEYVAVVARLDSFDRLRNAADEQHRSVRQVRLGLENTPLLHGRPPAISFSTDGAEMRKLFAS